MANGGRGGSESRLMGWGSAVDCMNKIWDKFLEEYQQNMDQKIDAVENQIAQLEGDPDPEAGVQNVSYAGRLRGDIERMRACKERFTGAFPDVREKFMGQLQQKLLKQNEGGKRALDFIASRHQKNVVRQTPKTRKKRKRTSKKRAHRRTGRPRGWNMRKYVLPIHRGGHRLSVRELRKHRRSRRKLFKQEQRANNFIRSVRRLAHQPPEKSRRRRYWKPYPARRAPKQPGWLQDWLRGVR